MLLHILFHFLNFLIFNLEPLSFPVRFCSIGLVGWHGGCLRCARLSSSIFLNMSIRNFIKGIHLFRKPKSAHNYLHYGFEDKF